jgi:hypothetical protein
MRTADPGDDLPIPVKTYRFVTLHHLGTALQSQIKREPTKVS